MFVNQTFFDGCRIFVVDDVATSMATKYELLEKIELEASRKGIKTNVAGIGIAVDREQTSAVYDRDGGLIEGVKGKNAINEFVSRTGIRVHAVAGIREVIGYLYKSSTPVLIEGKRAVIGDVLMAEFEEYLSIYGAV